MIKKFSFFILICLVFIAPVNATLFTSNTTFTEGNINYVFTEGLNIDDFDISPGGITINSKEKIGIDIEGGQLDVIFYKFDSELKKIGLKSNVPQTINFQISSSGNKQYLYDESSYYLNNYNIGTEEVKFKIVNFTKENSDYKKIKMGTKIKKLSWYNQKIVEFEVFKEIDSNGIIRNKTISITYLWFTIISLLIIILLTWWFR